MARNLTSIPDIQAPDADYPVGRIQNEETTPTPITGTPVIEELYGDIIQFFHKLIRLAGISHNGLPENETNGFQFITSLTAFVRTVLASTTSRGAVELADNAETQAGLDSQRAVTPAGLESKTATTTRKGIAEVAILNEAIVGTDNERIITPLILKQASRFDALYITSNGTYNMGDNYGVAIVTGGTSVIVRMPSNSYTRAGHQIRILNDSANNVTVQSSTGAVQYPTTIPVQTYTIFEYNGTGWTCVLMSGIPLG